MERVTDPVIGRLCMESTEVLYRAWEDGEGVVLPLPGCVFDSLN